MDLNYRLGLSYESMHVLNRVGSLAGGMIGPDVVYDVSATSGSTSHRKREKMSSHKGSGEGSNTSPLGR